MYKGRSVGFGRGDVLIHSANESILVELKATHGTPGDSEFLQLQRYLKFLNLNDGLLVHFGQKRGSSCSVFHATHEIIKKVENESKE